MSNTLLVIGIPREELAFGEYVAGLVAGQGVDVLRIPQGLSGQKPSPDDAFYDRLRHRELYLQLLRHVQRGHRLLIDLHTGLNESGRCADIFCQNTHLLDCLGHLLRERARACPPGREPIRLVRIITDQEAKTKAASGDAHAYAVSRTSIPEDVWASEHWVYVGLEVYLSRPGEGNWEDWRFAADIVQGIRRCREDQAEGGS